MPQHKRRRWFTGRAVAIAGSASLLGGFVLAAPAAPGSAATRTEAVHVTPGAACHLGNGIKHVVQITWDNTHFFRDNPNVPSDLQMMPNLLHFIENNGTLLSNNHTPLIAHTAPDILTTLTGLYGDRQGMWGGNNSFRSYNPDGTTDPASAFAYWTDPIFDTLSPPADHGARHDPAQGLLAAPAGHHAPAPGAQQDHPGAVGALHAGRLQRGQRLHCERGAGKHRRGHPQGVRPELARGQAARAG